MSTLTLDSPTTVLIDGRKSFESMSYAGKTYFLDEIG